MKSNDYLVLLCFMVCSMGFFNASAQCHGLYCFNVNAPAQVCKDSTFYLKVQLTDTLGNNCNNTITNLFFSSSYGINGLLGYQTINNGLDSFLVSLPSIGIPTNNITIGVFNGICNTTVGIDVVQCYPVCTDSVFIDTTITPSTSINGHNRQGYFIDTFTNVAGCDSLVYLNLNYFIEKSYGPDSLQKYDVYGRGNSVSVFIHGGGFTHGDKSNLKLCSGIKDTSEVFISINYRLLTDSTCALQSFEDCKMAIDSIKTHYAKVDVVGSSAGGMAALWACMQTRVNSVTLLNTPATMDIRYWKIDSFQNIISTIGYQRCNDLLGVDFVDGINDDLEMDDLYIAQFDPFIYMDSTDTPIIVKKINNTKIGSYADLVHHQGHHDLIVEAAKLYGVPIDSIP